jgi:hypothetical protein
LLIAEGVPNDGGNIGNRRFFCDDNLTGKDGLFREVIRALYDDPPLVSGPNTKRSWLATCEADGVFLIDLAAVPVNEFSNAERAAALARIVVETVSVAGNLDPSGIVLVRQIVFDRLEQPVRAAAYGSSMT